MNHLNIRELRREARVSQAELGLALGKTQTWLSLIERGILRMEGVEIQRLLDEIDRIAKRKEAIARAQQEAAERVSRDFENLKKSTGPGQ
jgi:transcriptional regulator with XRE-family HTH domain